MIEYVTGQAAVSGQGRLLDLACGTGQLTFPLRRRFSEVWAVDREPDMVEAVQAKADALEVGNIRTVTADAETLGAPSEYFELAVIGKDRRFVVEECLLGDPGQAGEAWGDYVSVEALVRHGEVISSCVWQDAAGGAFP